MDPHLRGFVDKLVRSPSSHQSGSSLSLSVSVSVWRCLSRCLSFSVSFISPMPSYISHPQDVSITHPHTSATVSSVHMYPSPAPVLALGHTLCSHTHSDSLYLSLGGQSYHFVQHCNKSFAYYSPDKKQHRCFIDRLLVPLHKCTKSLGWIDFRQHSGTFLMRCLKDLILTAKVKLSRSSSSSIRSSVGVASTLRFIGSSPQRMSLLCTKRFQFKLRRVVGCSTRCILMPQVELWVGGNPCKIWWRQCFFFRSDLWAFI